MLVGVKDVMLICMLHNVADYNMLEELATNTGQTNHEA